MSEGPEHDGCPPRARVWIVDDSPLQGELSRRTLEPLCDVALYDGGMSMLEALAASRPDVLILDWHMPDMSGLEVCRFVRARMNLAELPILIVTAHGTGDGLLEALAAGANDFVMKPFSDAELIGRVSGLARLASLHAKLVVAERNLRVEADFRERFMGMLAHDLRQPLNAIAMVSQAVAGSGALPERLSGYLGMQLRAAERMKRMIAELLDFTRSRPESGIPLEREWTDLAEIVRAGVEEVRIAQPEQPLTLTVQGPCSGYWDPDRLAQLCSNLIGNAFEHGSGTVPIDVRLTSRDERVELRVASSGAAIPKDVLATLFLPFRRGRGQKKRGGVGLGLHIVNQIVHAHGGTIAVESERGTTEFVVSLDRGQIDAPPGG
jgi:signal transduction histidine kinase